MRYARNILRGIGSVGAGGTRGIAFAQGAYYRISKSHKICGREKGLKGLRDWICDELHIARIIQYLRAIEPTGAGGV